MKTLIMLSAIPASGKSTWAKEYQQNHPNTYIVSSDEVRMEVCHGNYHDHTHQKEVWELFEKRIHEYGAIDNATVILDALNDVNPVRLKYLSTTPEFDKKILVLFPSTYEKSKKYNGMRDEEVRVPEDVLIGLYNKFEEPNDEVLSYVDEVIEVNW
ncbi:MAG: AAA family ATPase [Bacilli bacterium]|nr:AAA family ATPase [Bacilli bacterium]